MKLKKLFFMLLLSSLIAIGCDSQEEKEVVTTGAAHTTSTATINVNVDFSSGSSSIMLPMKCPLLLLKLTGS